MTQGSNTVYPGKRPQTVCVRSRGVAAESLGDEGGDRGGGGGSGGGGCECERQRE